MPGFRHFVWAAHRHVLLKSALKYSDLEEAALREMQSQAHIVGLQIVAPPATFKPYEDFSRKKFARKFDESLFSEGGGG